MSVSVTHKDVYTRNGETIQYSTSWEGGTIVEIDEDIPANQTDLTIVVAIDFSELEYLMLVSDVAMTIETNDGTTPADTISLLAGKPLIWKNDGYHANPFSADVTAFEVTNTTAGNLKMKAVMDVTP